MLSPGCCKIPVGPIEKQGQQQLQNAKAAGNRMPPCMANRNAAEAQKVGEKQETGATGRNYLLAGAL